MSSLDSAFHLSARHRQAGVTTFSEAIKLDDLVKSHQNYGFVKSSICKARKT